MIPVRSRPKGNQPYPCPKCNQLVSPETNICFNCANQKQARRLLLRKKATTGGMPFYILAILVALILAVFVLLML